MAYRNKTYVIFDADNDIRSYRLMQAWKAHDHIDFDFYDAHELNNLWQGSYEETIKRKLRERMNNAKQAIVLVGQSTKNLYKFVRWEIDLAMEMNLPIVVVNLNQKRIFDESLCPPILKNQPGMHVSFQPRIIKLALDDYVERFNKGEFNGGSSLAYNPQRYRDLGLYLRYPASLVFISARSWLSEPNHQSNPIALKLAQPTSWGRRVVPLCPCRARPHDGMRLLASQRGLGGP